MTLPYLLSILVFLPLIAGAFLLVFGEEDSPGFARGTALAVALVELVLSLPLLASAHYEDAASWIPALGIHYLLRADGLSTFMLLLVTVMTPIAILASWELIQARAKMYYGCILLLAGGMVGVVTSMDLFLFYVFWEIMLIPAFFLVGIFGGAKRREATTKFVIYTMLGSLLMLVGIVFVGARFYFATGHWSFNLLDLYNLTYATNASGSFLSSAGHWAFAAFVLAFGIKAAMFPLHTWLPDTYAEAPAPVTFLLSAVMSKMGIYGFLRIALPLFPAAAADFTPLLVTLAVVGVIYAALVALAQDDMKRLLAYASVSHLGIILLGTFSRSPQALTGTVVYMLAHALTTGGLFLLVGFLYERKGTTLISAYGGITRSIPVFSAVFMLVMLAGVGLPGLVGFVGEFMVFIGAFGVNRTAAGIATVEVVLGAGYMLWMYSRAFFGPLDRADNRALPDMNIREGLAFAPLVLLIVGLGLAPQGMISRISPAMDALLAHMTAQPSATAPHATADAPTRAAYQPSKPETH